MKRDIETYLKIHNMNSYTAATDLNVQRQTERLTKTDIETYAQRHIRGQKQILHELKFCLGIYLFKCYCVNRIEGR